MILSVSRRTDIPCLYAEWFINRIRAGFALTRNPMNAAQLSRIPLTPDIVDCIVFWSKDARPIMCHLDELDRSGYRYYFQFTITPYDHTIEPDLRPKVEIEQTLIELSKRIGRARIVWRYDPILLSERCSIAWHKEAFTRMCERLAPFTDTVTISFVDLYAKLKGMLMRAPTSAEIAELSVHMGSTARMCGVAATACCETEDLTRYGIGRASCIDRRRIERICRCPLDIRSDRNQRTGCGCFESVDIGAYNTCTNGCVYCYANGSKAASKRRFDEHDPSSPLLCGRVGETEVVRERIVRSNLVRQMTLL